MQQATQASTPAPAPLPPMLTTSITGTFSGLKAPAVNGVVALVGGAVASFTVAAAQALPSTAPPAAFATPSHITGDLTNGVAIAAAGNIAYLTGVGVPGAVWNTLTPPPLAKNASIVAMCGDLANGLVVSDGSNVYSWLFSGAGAQEWTLLGAPPVAAPNQPALSVIDLAGDPTNGVLLVMGPLSGPSSLYWGGAGCSCSWVPLTSAGTSLPVARVQIRTVCGSAANGFVILGENQLFTLGSIKYTPATSSALGSCTASLAKIAQQPPFTITDMTGDPTNGITARGAASGLIANALTPFAAWTLVNAVAPDNADDGDLGASAPQAS